MCGRFTLRSSAVDLVEIFQLLRTPELLSRYNIAPTQGIAVVRQNGQVREFSVLHWGLIPGWSKDPKAGPPLINARAETVATKPAFRSALARRRCLIPADGFYEWQKTGKARQPFYIHLKSGRPFAFAGLWEQWQRDGADPIESCTVITTEANELLRPIHDRMPAILAEEDYASWLDPMQNDATTLGLLLRPYPADEMQADPVSTCVNNARNDSPDCIRAPAAANPTLF